MKRWLLFAACLSPGVWPAEEPCDKVSALAREIEEITGLKQRRAIACGVLDRAGLKRFLEERIRDEVKPKEIRAEELVLKKFGFAPPDFDLKKVTLELLTEQAAAFYDFHRRKLFMVDSGPASLEEATLLHEIAHAVADQHFSLARFIDGAAEDDEASLARAAVVEGQATWLMAEFMARRMGRTLKDAPELLEMMRKGTGGSGGQFPVFDSAPLYLRESLLFPYSEGIAFQHAVFEKLGKAAFSEVFRRPPRNTQEILHPKLYFESRTPVVPSLPEPPSRRRYRVLIEGTIGEFDHTVLLRQYTSLEQARSLGPSWTGGLYKLYEHKRDGHTVLAYSSCWESETAAGEFFAAHGAIQKGKWRALRVEEEAPSRRAGAGDDGLFRVELSGKCLAGLEGLPRAGNSAAID